MSNHLAAATVSASLRDIVLAASQGALSGVQLDVETQRPDRINPDNGQAGARIFLYQVSPNPSWRNADLATRRSDGTLATKPQAALDLYYLLSFFGNELQQQPETLLGATVAALHSRPLLTRAQIQDTIAANAHLAASDLDQQVELVRFVPLSLNLEELSKLWSVFFQTAYRLSVAYLASVVLVEPEGETPEPALAVSQPVVSAGLLNLPELDAAKPQIVEPGGALTLEGRNLRGVGTRVHAGDAVAQPPAENLSGSRILVTLDQPPFAGAPLRAGVLPIRVSHTLMLGPQGEQTPHKGPSSNVVPVMLQPVIRPNAGNTGPDVVQGTDGGGNPTLTVTADPEIGTQQKVALLLNGATQSFVLDAEPLASDGHTVVFGAEGVPPGDYLVRLRVDGVPSRLTVDPVNGTYDGPSITVTP